MSEATKPTIVYVTELMMVDVGDALVIQGDRVLLHVPAQRGGASPQPLPVLHRPNVTTPPRRANSLPRKNRAADVLDAMPFGRPMGLADVGAALGIPSHVAGSWMSQLCNEGKIRRISIGVYVRDPPGTPPPQDNVPW